MQFTFTPITEVDIHEMQTWHYEEPADYFSFWYTEQQEKEKLLLKMCKTKSSCFLQK